MFFTRLGWFIEFVHQCTNMLSRVLDDPASYFKLFTHLPVTLFLPLPSIKIMSSDY